MFSTSKLTDVELILGPVIEHGGCIDTSMT